MRTAGPLEHRAPNCGLKVPLYRWPAHLHHVHRSVALSVLPREGIHQNVVHSWDVARNQLDVSLLKLKNQRLVLLRIPHW